jgi:hypothetical protein
MTSESKTTYAEELAEIFYQAKVPDGRWQFIPKNAQEAYTKAMQAVLDHIELSERGRL